MFKTILITGASSGFGLITAKLLHEKGHKVYGTSRNPERHLTNFELLEMDVQNQDSINQVISYTLLKEHKVDVLVNNAGYGIAGAIEETEIHEAKEQLETNFFGVVRMTKALLPSMRTEKSGLIINIGSIGGLIGLPFQGFYSASKFALEGYTEALRIEMRPFNINIVNINPGDYKTSFTKNRRIIRKSTEIYENKFKQALAIYEDDESKGANPEEVANLINSLLTKKKGHRVRYLTGARLQKVAVYLKKIVGSQIFEQIMINTYRQK